MFRQHGRIIPIFALATAGSLWGTGFYFGKIALAEMPVHSMVLFRFTFACAGLLPVIFFDRPHVAGSEWGWVVAASVLGVPLQYLVQFKRLSLTTVSHASLMVGTLPMLLAIAALVFAGERLHFGGWLALAGPQRSSQNRPLMVGSKAAINRVCPGRVLFYSVASCEGKSILVRQLRGPHLRT